ncbi:MAG: NAD(P)H-dependent oxidoreductase subunit E [Parcubacteria group bacterium]|jgi:NADH-quinone oxidoreductase subunit E
MIKKTIQNIILEFEPEAKNILPALKKISAVFGYVSEEDAKIMAEYFGVSESKIFETASFYDEIKTEKQPDILVQICNSANCTVNNSFSIISEVENLLKIKSGRSVSLKFKLEEISCLGRCADGPVMVVNGKIYERVTKSSLHSILEEYL